MTRTITFEPGSWTLPIDLGPMLDADGAHSLPLSNGAAQFDFGYRDIRFVGQVDPAPGGARLRLVGDVGLMPYSAESPPARLGLARILVAANDALAGPRFRVTQGRILVGADIELSLPLTAAAIVAAVALVLVRVRPYLDLIAVYVRPPLAPADSPGESPIRPEWRRSRRR